MLSALRSSGVRKQAGQTFSAFYSTVSGLTRRTANLAPRLANQDHHELEVDDDDDGDGASSSPLNPLRRKPPKTPTPRQYAAHRTTLKKAFPEGWSPPHKISREAIEGLRAMHAQSPETFTTPLLAEKFRISPEAVRRILKSKWVPSAEERERLKERERRYRQEMILQRRLEERRKQQELERETGRLSEGETPRAGGWSIEGRRPMEERRLREKRHPREDRRRTEGRRPSEGRRPRENDKYRGASETDRLTFT